VVFRRNVVAGHPILHQEANPPTCEAITGAPQAMASSATIPKDS